MKQTMLALLSLKRCRYYGGEVFLGYFTDGYVTYAAKFTCWYNLRRKYLRSEIKFRT